MRVRSVRFTPRGLRKTASLVFRDFRCKVTPECSHGDPRVIPERSQKLRRNVHKVIPVQMAHMVQMLLTVDILHMLHMVEMFQMLLMVEMLRFSYNFKEFH